MRFTMYLTMLRLSVPLHQHHDPMIIEMAFRMILDAGLKVLSSPHCNVETPGSFSYLTMSAHL
jgi:hypothetical protein